MNTAIILLAGLVTAFSGYYVFAVRRGLGFNRGNIAGSLPTLFISSQAAYHAVSTAEWPAAYISALIAAGLLMPIITFAEKHSASNLSGLYIIRQLSLLILSAAIFKGLTAAGLNPILVLCFAAAGFTYLALADKIGKTFAMVLSNIMAVSGIYLYLLIPETISVSDIALMVAIVMAYTLGTLSPQSLEKFREVLTPLHISLLVVFASAVLFSPISHVEVPDVELKLGGVYTVMPLIFLAFSPAGSASVSRLFETSLLFLAVSIAAVGGPFYNASAQLLAPIVGEPVKGLTAQIVQAVMQLVGLSALVMVFNWLAKIRLVTADTRKQTMLTYCVPAAAVGLAVSYVIGPSVEQIMFLAGIVNMIVFSLILANSGGKYLLVGIFLFLLAFNINIAQIFSQLAKLQPPANPMAFTSFISSILSLLAIGIGIWGFSSAIAGWLSRRGHRM